ncbi:hypothetical protein M406DRAFT_243966, partial [Cryphonectria parasitica EP155]
ILSLLPLTTLATIDGHCSGTATGEYLEYGICISTATCSDYGGSYITGGCPNDPNNIKCCVVGLEKSASTDPCGGSSYCSWNNLGCAGTYKPGQMAPPPPPPIHTRKSLFSCYCPGGKTYECC